jgi:hypothetical protein
MAKYFFLISWLNNLYTKKLYSRGFNLEFEFIHDNRFSSQYGTKEKYEIKYLNEEL